MPAPIEDAVLHQIIEYAGDGYSPQSELARELLRAREAVADLMAEQNGPPLIRHKDRWEAAMAKCRACLPAAAGGEPYDADAALREATEDAQCTPEPEREGGGP